jgi:hypothetical protein
VRFTHPAALNDPFEGQPLFGDIVSPEQLDSLVEYLWSDKSFLESFTDLWVSEYYDNSDPKAKAMFSRDFAVPRIKEILAGQITANDASFRETIKAGVRQNRELLQSNVAAQVIQAMQRDLVVLSLSAVNDDPRLWGLYADSQAGIAIGFDSDDAFLGRILKVQYVSERPRISVSRAFESKDEQRRVAAAMISTKGRQWEYEQEYRVVRAAQEADQTQDIDGRGFPVYLFGFPPSAISEVIIGNRMVNDGEKHLRSVIAEPRYRHVRIGRVELGGSHFRLEINWLEI